MSERKIGVLVVDDQTLVRQGLLSLLRLAGDVKVVAEAASGEDALAALSEHRHHIDVMLLDVRMPGMSGVDVLRALGAQDSLPPTLILTTFDDDQVVLEGLRAGARGYLLKDVSLDRLLGAVRTLAGGGQMIQPVLTERLRGLRLGPNRLGPNDQAPGSFAQLLTERETDVLRLMAGGYSNKEIADSLFLSEGTVKNHVSNVLSKLEVRDRTRAVLRALEQGLI